MSSKFCFDSNVLITAWNDSHPPDVFSSLWKKFSISKNEMIFIKPIFEEIDPGYTDEEKEKYPLKKWLWENKFSPTSIDSEVEEEALRLEEKYKTQPTGKGANSNDIRLIAYAKCKKLTVVTFEKVQTTRPKQIYNYKIPLVCKDEGVACIIFVDFLREIGISI